MLTHCVSTTNILRHILWITIFLKSNIHFFFYKKFLCTQLYFVLVWLDNQLYRLCMWVFLFILPSSDYFSKSKYCSDASGNHRHSVNISCLHMFYVFVFNKAKNGNKHFVFDRVERERERKLKKREN